MTAEQHGPITLHHGDCLDVLRGLPDASIDAVVTDPPYGLSFMGKAWDKPTPRPEACRECGNDDPTEGYLVCSDCLEELGHDGDQYAVPEAPAHGGRFMLGHVSANWHDKGTHSRGYADNDNAAFQAWCQQWAVECLRVLKPGGHMLAFGGTRTWHRLACAVEDAGFEVRDSLAWLYGSGFPKSLDVSKAIDKRGGKPHLAAEVGAAIKAAREARGWSTTQADRHFCRGTTNWTWFEGRKGECRPPTPATFARIVAEWPELADWAEQVAEAEREVIGQGVSGIGTAFGDGEWTSAAAEVHDITAPRTEAARTWQGWGTALKPAFEPVVVARKPLAGTVAANVLAHGTGALNIDGCRIGDELLPAMTAGQARIGTFERGDMTTPERVGRWPANVVLDEHQAAELDRMSGEAGGGFGGGGGKGFTEATGEVVGYGDTGGASRFFYVAKADSSERVRLDGTAHPTVKPLDLMRWLVRLVTPPGGTVLEPFAGSGTTAEACLLEGFRCIAIEREADYLPLIRQRLNRRRDPVAAVRASGDDAGLFDLLEEGA